MFSKAAWIGGSVSDSLGLGALVLDGVALPEAGDAALLGADEGETAAADVDAVEMFSRDTHCCTLGW